MTKDTSPEGGELVERLKGAVTEPRTLRVLVCGGRHYPDRAKVHRSLDQLAEVSDEHMLGAVQVTVIHGASTDPETGMLQGADLWADEWAVVNWAGLEPYPADWDRLGRRAGPIRNAEMLFRSKPDLVLAFPTPGAPNKGTNDMISKARRKGIEVRIL